MNENRTLILNTLAIRIMALLFMTLDHIGIFLLLLYPEGSGQYETGSVFRVIGRIAFPLFAFLLAEGMRHTHSKEKYLLRIGGMMVGICAVQSILVYGFQDKFAFLGFAGNPFFDLFFVALTLYCLTLPKWKKFFAALPIAVIIASFVVGCVENMEDITILWWPFMYRPTESLLGLGAALGFFYGPIIATKSMHSFNQQQGISDEMFLETGYGRRMANVIGSIIFFAAVLALWGLSYLNNRAYDPLNMSMQSWGLLAAIPIFFYSGRKGPGGLAAKIVFYAYFPVHLIILVLIFGI